jgi:uncharacterized protein YfkK (UPF0435 family)
MSKEPKIIEPIIQKDYIINSEIIKKPFYDDSKYEELFYIIDHPDGLIIQLKIN